MLITDLIVLVQTFFGDVVSLFAGFFGGLFG